MVKIVIICWYLYLLWNFFIFERYSSCITSRSFTIVLFS